MEANIHCNGKGSKGRNKITSRIFKLRIRSVTPTSTIRYSKWQAETDRQLRTVPYRALPYYRITVPYNVPVLDRPKARGTRQQDGQQIPLACTLPMPNKLERLADEPQHLRQESDRVRPRGGLQVFLVVQPRAMCKCDAV